jgi:hypothetical protein
LKRSRKKKKARMLLKNLKMNKTQKNQKTSQKPKKRKKRSPKRKRRKAIKLSHPKISILTTWRVYGPTLVKLTKTRKKWFINQSLSTQAETSLITWTLI